GAIEKNPKKICRVWQPPTQPASLITCTARRERGAGPYFFSSPSPPTRGRRVSERGVYISGPKHTRRRPPGPSDREAFFVCASDLRRPSTATSASPRRGR